jgi:hypothetical protein
LLAGNIIPMSFSTPHFSFCRLNFFAIIESAHQHEKQINVYLATNSELAGCVQIPGDVPDYYF